ncbi:MAG: Maf family protein [Planctomycetota bacterium]
MLDLLLASTSRYRRELLERLGVSFRCLAPAVDEEPIKRLGLEPRSVAERLAREKALSLADREPTATIIGSDQVAAVDRDILGKPGTAARAIAQLSRLAGREHILITAVAIWHRGQLWEHTEIARLTMRALTSDELARYVAADSPLDCAGSYKLEQRGVGLFAAIDCADHSAITGLPLIAVAGHLRTLGYSIP